MSPEFSENSDMEENDREEYENVLVLENIVEANLMESLLNDEGISFYIREWKDVNFDGVWTEQKGYGWLMGRKADENRIRKIYTDRVGHDEKLTDKPI